jgi:hypothetical protein
MKAIVVTIGAIGVVTVAGTALYLNHEKSPSIPAATETTPVPAQTAPVQTPFVASHQPPQPATQTGSAAPTPAPAPVAPTSQADDAAAILRRKVDALVSPQTSFSDKQALLKQLKADGQLEDAIADLQQRAAANPNDAQVLTALGEASLNKFPLKNYNESGILALQVDEDFNAALKIDPSNWEAQYEKAYSLSYWPAEMNKGQEVVQQLSGLIDQQQTMTAQPQFANTYVLLGDEYQKLGQNDYAAATWKLGLSQFPMDSGLQKRTAAQ